MVRALLGWTRLLEPTCEVPSRVCVCVCVCVELLLITRNPPVACKMHIVIRKFQPSDHVAVAAIFRDGIQEHINPSFISAVFQPLHIFLTLSSFTAGYILGGQSVGLALLAGGSWIGLLYYCCYELYASYVQLKLCTDMQDIPGFYLSSPDNCFWVAEAEINGRPRVMGMVAVEAKTHSENGTKYGELFRMIVSSEARRTGLGLRLGQTAVDFCKERGFSKIVLGTSSTQTAAVALYNKMGYTLVRTHKDCEAPWWVIWMSRVTILSMEKIL